MPDNYRQCLAGIARTNSTHPGLWLDKYMPGHETGSGQVLVADVAAMPVPDAYRKFYDRWKAVVEQDSSVITKTATVRGRLSIGLGGESVLETAITLHRIYGVPYIPGSALKGLAAYYARNRLQEGDWGVKSKAYQIMFGDTTSAGYLTFFDALYVPGTGHGSKPLWPDVITVHHPQYYQGNEQPADWDSPTPISFLSATGSYLLAIGGDPAWVGKAFEILNLALAAEGIGAKTSSGYGRMTIAGMSVPNSVQPSSSNTAQQAKSSLVREIRQGVIVEIRPDKRRGRVRDDVSGYEYRFDTSVIEPKGSMPKTKAKVAFELEGGKIVRVKGI